MEAAVRFLIIIALFATGVTGQVAREANREYATAEERAKLVPRLENPARLARIRPTELVKRLDVRPGSVVVDLGTGTGNLLAALSKAVGPKGRVVAEDIHSDFLDRARSRANSDGLDNVDFVLGTETDPHLPEGMADLVIVLDAYHHFDYPEKMLAAIRRGLKPGGRLAIIEYHKARGAMEVAEDPDFAIRHVRAGAEQVEQEVQAAGYRLLWRREHAPGSQYIAMLQKH
jgi:ubiquinone/menaquinone biosynthesis C-methylase UbiE